MMNAYYLLTDVQQQYLMFRPDAKIKETLKCATHYGSHQEAPISSIHILDF
jgi:hypothetical protein